MVAEKVLGGVLRVRSRRIEQLFPVSRLPICSPRSPANTEGTIQHKDLARERSQVRPADLRRSESIRDDRLPTLPQCRHPYNRTLICSAAPRPRRTLLPIGPQTLRVPGHLHPAIPNSLHLVPDLHPKTLSTVSENASPSPSIRVRVLHWQRRMERFGIARLDRAVWIGLQSHSPRSRNAHPPYIRLLRDTPRHPSLTSQRRG